MVRVEEIRKECDPRIIQTTQRYFAPFHVQFPILAFRRIKYSVFFTVKEKKIYPSPSLSIASATGDKDIPKTSKGHKVASVMAPSVCFHYGGVKAFQGINFFSEIEKSSTGLSTISKISCYQMKIRKPKQVLTNTNEYGK